MFLSSFYDFGYRVSFQREKVLLMQNVHIHVVVISWNRHCAVSVICRATRSADKKMYPKMNPFICWLLTKTSHLTKNDRCHRSIYSWTHALIKRIVTQQNFNLQLKGQLISIQKIAFTSTLMVQHSREQKMLVLDPAYSTQTKLVRKYLTLVELTALIMKQKQKQHSCLLWCEICAASFGQW